MPYDKKLNILILLARYPGYGGIETVTTQLANHWVHNHNIVIASLRQQEESLLEQLSSSIKFKKFPYCGIKKSYENIVYLNNLLVDENIDILIYQDSYFPCQYLLENIHRHNLKIIQVDHNCPNGFEKEYKIAKNLGTIERFKGLINYIKSKRAERRNRRLIHRVCDRLVMLAKEYIPICQRLGGISDNDKFRVIGNPLSITIENNELNLKSNECIFVGRMDPVKGLDRLLRIWSKVEATVPNWSLTLVGDGVDMPIVKELINSYKLRYVKLAGFQKNVEDYYRRAKIYCMCSTYEGFPMVLPEAMAHGVVPIAFNSFDSYASIVSNGINGISVKPYDEDQYASELISLMKNKSKLYEMQIECERKAKEFTPEYIFSLWDNLFEELMTDK